MTVEGSVWKSPAKCRRGRRSAIAKGGCGAEAAGLGEMGRREAARRGSGEGDESVLRSVHDHGHEGQ